MVSLREELGYFYLNFKEQDFGSTPHLQQMSRSFYFETGLVKHIPCYTLFPQMNTVKKNPTFLQLEQCAQVSKMQSRLNECPEIE